SWAQGVRKLADRFPVVPQVDLVPAVERYFDFVQRAVDLNRGITLRWAQAAGTLSGAVRERAESAGQVALHRAESVADVVRERAESFEQAAARQAEQVERVAARQADQAEQAGQELAHEARRLEREQARQAHQRARERYEGLTKAELSKQLAQRDLPKSGTVNELIERLVEADAAR
ncbi:MAG TPA: SAP domain-containing protein, partial [Streptosporangiaceae bacterium]